MVSTILQILAIASILLVLYGLTKEYVNIYINLLADLVILVCSSLIVISIYLPVNTRPAEEISKNITAPFVLSLFLFLFIYSLFKKKWVPVLSIKGIAILGLTGALFRLVSYG